MAVEAKRTAAHGTSLEHIGRLLLGLVIPIWYCSLLLYAKGTELAGQLAAGAWSNTRGQLEIVYQLLSLAFAGLLAVLFVTRKRAVGPRASVRDALVALAGSFFPSLLLFGAPAASDTLLIVSLSTMVVGMALTVWSLAALGRCFGVFPAARGLVTHGPYSKVRHPLYTSEAVVTCGLMLGRFSVLSAAIFVAGCLFQLWRSHNEERVLEGVFPEYGAYRARTGRFVPPLPGLRR